MKTVKLWWSTSLPLTQALSFIIFHRESNPDWTQTRIFTFVLVISSNQYENIFPVFCLVQLGLAGWVVDQTPHIIVYIMRLPQNVK